MEVPVLYILAGPNGIGKTTSAYSIIPATVPIINSDEIAKQVRAAEIIKVSTQEYSNREAQKLVKEQLDRRATFAIETNLSDEETWKFLAGVQRSGYKLHLVFLSTDDLNLLHNRIRERHLRGEHYVRPDVVEERYYVGLQLLKRYATVPDVVQLIDNSTTVQPIAIKREGIWRLLTETPPNWIANYLGNYFRPEQKQVTVKDLATVEEVKKRYRKNNQ